ncbi:50S ribosomal protein L9 [Butyricicoccus porcorum]|uniref:Large ribosomal subunit protein bL9 n=1 Tax=Butyricicoccus porcorum TaxID=1945634 RepID=A0A252F7M8_9FIRM|nr:50S ribosomal protein L9 [Butyricicoccus porcorum]MCI6926453.1 50S ribosomal protein L9 [Butyricicoccus porcorum]MDD6986197.1 50S ribosomal protein L9 [Butyricicoccus porcorum]MDY4482607.1 50S ribosomal protein L9 [Butyricicoccus porcorum]OUM21773.1 50S ribosomal protein L9 [Butyricicoccus porcorum]
MKVILQQDVKGKGKKGQLVEVSEGYGRNYLLPRGLAVAATADNMNQMKQAEEARAHREAVERAEAEANAKKFESIIVHMTAKGGTSGRIFGSVTSKEIAAQLKKEHGIEINKQKIVLDEAIKTFGTFELKVKLYPEVVGKLKVQVTEAE